MQLCLYKRYAFRNPATLSVTLDTAEGALNRVDRVVGSLGFAAKRYVYCGAERHTVCKADSNGSNTHYGNMGACACRYLRRKGRNKVQTQNIDRPAI